MRPNKIVPIAAVFVSLLAGLVTLAHAEVSLASHVAPILSRATDMGALERSSPVEITVWLKLHDSARLEAALAAQRDGQAAWLSNEQVQAQHAPGAAEAAAMSAFLSSRGLTVTGVGAHNLYVKASGTAASVQYAFGVELRQYSLNGRTFHASTTGPSLPDAIAPLVASVGGLTNLGANPMLVRPVDPDGAAPKPVPLSARPNGLVFSAQCFTSPETHSFSSSGVSATYQGNRYGTDINNTAPGTVAPCGYQPSDLQTAYNMTPLYRAGYDGTGETIAIVDAFGSTTIAHDVAVFSRVMGLPPANLTILGTPTESGFSGDPNSVWADETTLDVEWVHAMAPGAKILLVVTPDNSFDNLLAGIALASMQRGVVAISNSWGSLEVFTDGPRRAAGDNVFRLANAKGIAVNFSSGDSGNETIRLGVASADWPTSSPYVTSIGGVSVALNASKQISFQTSWGNNLTQIADTVASGSPPDDPPFNEGFVFGGGGGTSDVYPLPSFQRSLGGQRRLVPDVSWTADPYTGVEIIETLDAQGDQFVSVIGGTSLACPMFSALWGIAAQHAGRRLGQAAPYLYNLPPGAITDVLTLNSPNNVTGVLTDANGSQTLTSWILALPLQGIQSFYSALYNSPNSTSWFVITFGTDSTLKAGPGWDPATGLGTPNGVNFVQAFPRHD